MVLSVLLRYKDYDNAFGIFNLLQSQVYLCPVENLTELHVYEKFEDPKGVIYSRTSMKHRHMCMVHVNHFLTPEYNHIRFVHWNAEDKRSNIKCN